MKKCIVMLLCAGLFLTGCASQENPGMQFEESPAASYSAIKTITPDDKAAEMDNGSKNTETKDFTKLELKDYQLTNTHRQACGVVQQPIVSSLSEVV